jgi:ethanolamine permease
VNLLGAHASLRVLLAITAVAALVLVVWAIAVFPHADPARWLDVEPDAGAARWLPHGLVGIAAALPAAGWFFLAIEGVPLAAEETRSPERDLPRAMGWAMATLALFAFAILLLAPAVAGTRAIGGAANPLPAAAEAAFGQNWLFVVTTVVGLLGFAASMLSIVYAYARQIFALARAGYLPAFLAQTSARGVPHWATIVPALVGLAAIFSLRAIGTGDVAPADLLMQIAVFAALVSYVAMMLSHIVLRYREPELRRPYRTPLAPFTPALALVLALVALAGSLLHGVAAGTSVLATAAVLALGLVYFLVFVRRRVAARSVDEELAIVRAAEEELEC